MKNIPYQKYKDLVSKYEVIVNRIASIRLVMFIVMVISFILKYYYYKMLFQIIFVLSLVSFIILVIVSCKYFKVYDYYVKYLAVIDTYISRLNGKWKNFEDKGTEFLETGKYYLEDLDIFGDCSLFQYLTVCKTNGGRDRLASKLSNVKLTDKEYNSSQKLIEELASDLDFCVNFQVMMDYYNKKDINLSKELDAFKNNVGSKYRDFIIGIIASVICVGLFMLGYFKVINLSYFYGMFFFNLLISFLYLFIYKEEFDKIDKVVRNYSKLFKVFEFVGNYNAHSSVLIKMSNDMKEGLSNIKALRKLDELNSLKNNFLSGFLLNGMMCLNLFIMHKYILIVESDLKNLLNSIKDIEELEAMISLAGIGILKENKCMPIMTNDIELNFSAIKHPLIDEEKSVSNDFNTKEGVNIITGSNMGGKTTFLRTIGINLILMQAGTYVCADDFKASYFKLFTSMRVTDNIDKGISTFYGELLRIKDMVEYVNNGKMLVLIDEIFKGTNYNDRIYGAKEVVRKLNNKNTVAFITTHDFELCESSRVKNYHVKEDYEGDKIVFDYKIRKGKCSSTNAKYLMKKLGIIDK